MTYEDLQKQIKAIQREEDAFVAKCGRKEIALKKRYIKEHAPLELKYNQRIIVRLKGKRYYSIDDIFRGWWIFPKGLRPCLYYKEYSQEDEILGIQLHPQQPEGDCRKCLLYGANGHFCDRTGGHRKNKYNKLEKDCLPCPRYEEIVEGGLWAKKCVWPHRHHPNVTFVRDEKGKKTYHIFEGHAWRCFTEHSEEDVERYYSREPIDYSNEQDNEEAV